MAKRKKLSTKSKVALGGASILAAIIAGTLLKGKIKAALDVPTALAAVKEEQAISEENIRSIATEESLEVDTKISELSIELNDQFFKIGEAKDQITFFEIEIQNLQAEIALTNSEILGFDESIALTRIDLTTAQEDLNAATNTLNTITTALGKLQVERVSLGFNPFLILAAADLDGKILIKEAQLRIATILKSDAQVIVNTGNNNLNSLLLQKSAFQEEFLFPLRIRLVASQNSLVIWKASFTAANQVVEVLRRELSGLGVLA